MKNVNQLFADILNQMLGIEPEQPEQDAKDDTQEEEEAED